jgi:hypothetical protein
MGDQHMLAVVAGYGVPYQFAIVFIQVQAVLAQQRYHLEAKTHVHGMQYLADLRFADLVVTHVIEIDLVDGSAGCNDQQLVYHDKSRFLRLGNTPGFGHQRSFA